ncbi:MAG: leucyl/phenylalanyl-tRNA--protein transferase [Acidobacteria bacterium]|nr:leucyl/phenylalanyl-tRNA--protein transferase [Acidobacteriota bacterium]
MPAAESATEEGLVAIGGALTVPRLREAYSRGLFPWSARPVTWWSPDPRAVFPLDGLRVSRRLAQKIRQQRYRVSVDEAFPAVIEACASQPRQGETTWITQPFQKAYAELHQAGAAHSLEIWGEDGSLVGGVYGVATGACFSGESMFHRRPDASKLALYHLVERLREKGFQLFDAQVLNPFTEQMGAVEISRSQFLALLRRAIAVDAGF